MTAANYAADMIPAIEAGLCDHALEMIADAFNDIGPGDADFADHARVRDAAYARLDIITSPAK